MRPKYGAISLIVIIIIIYLCIKFIMCAVTPKCVSEM